MTEEYRVCSIPGCDEPARENQRYCVENPSEENIETTPERPRTALVVRTRVE